MSRLSPEERELFSMLPDPPPSASTNPNGALAMHRLLQTLDPAIASRWHWRDTRKVHRSLRIIAETGRLPSAIVAEQSETDLIARYEYYSVKPNETQRARYRTLFFWLFAEPSALNPRLDRRVDQMLQVQPPPPLKQDHKLTWPRPVAGTFGRSQTTETTQIFHRKHWKRRGRRGRLYFGDVPVDRWGRLSISDPSHSL